MWSKYDENINKNPFFMEINKNHSDIIEKCSKENWIICIPRIGAIEENKITIDTIFDNILIPNPDNKYCTLNKKHVKIENHRINVESEGMFENSVEILFEETFYIGGHSKYIIWCIDSPLFSDTSTLCDIKIQTLESVHDCIDFLWMESLGHGILDEIQLKCEKFLQTQYNFEMESLQTQKDLIGNLYSQTLQIALKNNNLNKKCENDEFLNKLKIAVETFMQHCLGKKLIYSINTVTCSMDSHFNKIICNSQNIKSKDFLLSNKLNDLMQFGKCELSKLNYFTTVLDKISCLKRTFSVFQTNKQNFYITSDDILQILVNIILKLNISNWIANLLYIKEFRFSLLEYSDENNYFITSFEAAIEFIKSNQFLSIRKSIDFPHFGNLLNIFNEINLYGLKALNKHTSINKNIVKNLCHPLCTCEKCDYLINQTNFQQKTNTILNLCNENGQNLLICAVILENRGVIERLLNDNNISINYSDYFKKTALHYSCLNGQQDILLLLISKGANVNCLDNEKNTPLHLACNNGHFNCVKALLYASHNLDLNLINEYGDTALHLSTKWSHKNITQLLLENNANKTISNKRNQLPIDLATNYYIKQLFQTDNKEANFKLNTITKIVTTKDYWRPKTAEQFKKIDLLLKAIENNDLPLTCFYLGFNHNVIKSTNEQLMKKCHPLCDCTKCNNELDYVDIKPKSQLEQHFNINTCNVNGYTALHVAAKYDRIDIMRLLLDCCASVNVRTHFKLYTPLHLACICQRIQNVKELLKCGQCCIDAIDSNGNTPLYYACMKNDYQIVELLITNGADCNRRNNSGYTILQELQHTKINYKIFKLLKNHSNLGSLQQNNNKDDWLT